MISSTQVVVEEAQDAAEGSRIEGSQIEVDESEEQSSLERPPSAQVDQVEQDYIPNHLQALNNSREDQISDRAVVPPLGSQLNHLLPVHNPGINFLNGAQHSHIHPGAAQLSHQTSDRMLSPRALNPQGLQLYAPPNHSQYSPQVQYRRSSQVNVASDMNSANRNNVPDPDNIQVENLDLQN